VNDAVAQYREAMERLAAGEGELLADLITDDIVYHQIGEPAIRGKDALMASMQGYEGTAEWSIDIHDVLANEEHMVALVEATVTAGDESITYRTAEIMHVDEDGKVTERWAFSDDTQAIIDFFSKLGAG
jgi:limonene-1,2-epoxide hydrolase